MNTLTITIDPRTEADLNQMSEREGTDASLMAARLLARAVRAARPRPVYDIERLKAYAAENEAEELALADSDPVHRAELLAQEDAA
jgi:hypothetical protein